MATSSIAYATAGTVTWTPASLADGSYDGSASVTNAVTLYMDVAVGGFITAGTSPTAGTIDIYAYGTWDGGTTFTAGMAGTDGDSPDTGEEGNLFFVASITNDTTSNHQYEWHCPSLAAVFGGVLPEDWGLVVHNQSNVALNATAGNHEAKYTGINFTSA